MHPTRFELLLYVVARLEAHARGVDRGTLGYSIIPSNGERPTMSYVCYGWVRAVWSMFTAEQLLGLARAHEIGHLLLGTNAHSNIGLMRALWPRTDLESGHWEDFMFTRDQARRLRTAFLDRRTNPEQFAKETCNGNRIARYSPKILMGRGPFQWRRKNPKPATCCATPSTC
jgi:hypothetical protein